MRELKNCTVLIVEDMKTNINILVEALKDHHQLGVASDGKLALEYVKKHMPDLILLDIMMPVMDGFETCKILKSEENYKNIPVIFISAMDDSKHITKGFQLGAVDYVTKPFNIEEVKARVKTHLSLKIAKDTIENQNLQLEEKVRERTKELENTQNEIITRLGLAAEYRDEETGLHIKRMSKLCQLMGREAGLSEEESTLLGRAATMHDIGKIGLPDTILLKSQRLSHVEREIMKTHTGIGAKLLSGSNSKVLQAAEVIVRTHHERWDGSGYMKGLKGEEIPLYGRIAGICDVFDALISDRPYKKAWPISKALNEIEQRSGTYFDPRLVKLILKLEPEIRRINKKFKKLEEESIEADFGS